MSKSQQPADAAGRSPAGTGEPAGILRDLQSEVSAEAAPLLRFIAGHATLIMGLLALFALIVAGAGAWQWYAAKRDEEARLTFSRLLMRQTGAARAEALARFAEDAPDSVRLAAFMELGLAFLDAGDAEKAAAAYSRVASQNQDRALGTIAALAQAESLNRAGKADDALAVLEGLENRVSENIRPRVRNMLALAALRAGKPERAVKAYEDLLAGAFGEDADFYRFRIARLKDTLQTGETQSR
jgi:predicted negative regulator of RcsB-dependent stress response